MAQNGNPELTWRQRRFVAALLVTPNVDTAAEAAGLSRRTGYRYLREPAVKAALSEALDSEIATAAVLAVRGMRGALRTLIQIHLDAEAPAGSRVNAARAITDAGPRLREAHDLADRVAALEERIGGDP